MCFKADGLSDCSVSTICFKMFSKHCNSSDVLAHSAVTKRRGSTGGKEYFSFHSGCEAISILASSLCDVTTSNSKENALSSSEIDENSGLFFLLPHTLYDYFLCCKRAHSPVLAISLHRYK